MSIERGKDETEILCDGVRCNEFLSIPSRDWDDVVQEMRDEKWQSVRDGANWTHFCPSCQEDMKTQILKESGLG